MASNTGFADRRKVWDDALRLPGQPELAASIVAERSDFTGLRAEEVQDRFRMAVDDSRKEWEAEERRDPAAIRGFYESSQAYLFEHMSWHALQHGRGPLDCVDLLQFALARGLRRYLDYGAGVGSAAILMAKHGFEVTLADVAPPMAALARWRFEKRGLAARFIDLRSETPPSGSFDLILAMDVLEHVVDAVATLAELRSYLAPGGYVAFNLVAGKDPSRPMHLLESKRPVREAVRAIGFAKAGRAGHLLLYRRVERGDLGRGLVATWDRVRWRIYHAVSGR